jgi:hypothetical protein
MKSIIIKIVMVGIYNGISLKGFCQTKTDGIFLFKMWFYIEHINKNPRIGSDYPIKDSSLFQLYQSAVNIKPDTLTKNEFTENYIFLSIAPVIDKKIINDSVLSYNKTKQLAFVSIPVDNCNGYVLCVNVTSGKSYRLRGFFGNDFMDLLKEVKAEYLTAYNKKLSTKEFLKKYFVTGVNFSCLYQGLSSGNTDTKNKPCLERCSDLIITVH